MEYPKAQITPLLEDVINDNPTYSFPVQSIQYHLLNMMMNQEEFDYCMMMCYNKLKDEHPSIFAEIFITTLELILDTKTNDPYTLPKEVFESKIDGLIETLSSMQVTRVDKNTPDGEMMSEMK
jgi:hypothetical protein